MSENDNADQTVVAGNTGQPPAAAQSLLDQALLAHWERRYAQAEALYKQVLKLDPGLLSGHVKYAILLAQQGRPGEAAEELKQAFIIDADGTANRLRVAQEQEPHNSAISDLWDRFEFYRESLQTQRAQDQELLDRVKQLVQTGQAALQAEQWGDALRIANAILADLPESKDAQSLKAKAEAEIAAAQRRDQVRQHLASAERFEAQGDYESASAELEAAQQLLPGDDEIQERLEAIEGKKRVRQQVARYRQDAQQKVAEGDRQKARQILELAIQLDPGDASLREAMQQVERQGNAAALLEKARVLISSNLATALDLVRQARNTAPDIPGSQTLEADIQARLQVEFAIEQALKQAADCGTQERWHDARQVLDNALKTQPDDPRLRKALSDVDKNLKAYVQGLLGQGHAAQEIRELKKALELYERAASMAPEHTRAQKALAELKDLIDRQARAQVLGDQAQQSYAAGDYAAAERALRQAIELVPGNELFQATLRQWEQKRTAREQATIVEPPPEPSPAEPPLPEPPPVETLPEEPPQAEPPPPSPAEPPLPEPPPIEPSPQESSPAEALSPESVPDDPDEAVRYYAQRSVTAWQAGDTAECTAAAQQGYGVKGSTKQLQALRLQCGLAWAGLAWASSEDLPKSELQVLSQTVLDIERQDKPLRADFNAHLLSHLARAMLARDTSTLANLALDGNTPDKDDQQLVKLVDRHARLDDQARQDLYDALKAKASGDMGALVVHTITELLRRRV
ncbi:MAG: hypothetical protein JW850_14400 [Thermoflexales bacterium]|nr:hypothetical protein [Thermoflexales bacterium]